MAYRKQLDGWCWVASLLCAWAVSIHWVPVLAQEIEAPSPDAVTNENEPAADPAESSGPESSGEEAQRAYQKGVLIRLEGMITPLLEQFLYRKLDQARELGADLVIVEIDSPGGFVQTTLNMAERLRSTDWATTVAFVPREAISGGAILCLGCDETVVAKESRLGDAGQIMMGADNAFRYVPEKERSYLVQQVRALAEATDRPPALAEAMVDMDLVVYAVKNQRTNEETFMSDAEIEAADDSEDWIKGKPVLESREKHFLTVKGERAVELQLAVGISESREEVSSRYGLRDQPVVMERNAVDTAVYILNRPFVTALLFIIGLVAIYFELSAPGISIGGLTAGLCFSLFFWSRFLGGTAGWLEVILFAAGVVFLVVEFFVIPGFGVSGIAGVLLITVSILMASQNFLIPRSPLEVNTTMTSLAVLVGSGFAFFLAAAVLSRYLGSIPVLSWMALELPAPEESTSEAKAGGKPTLAATATEGSSVQVGDWGVADSPLRPAGKARIGKDYVDVVTDGTFVDPGRQVRVIAMSGNRIVVREIPEEDPVG